MIWLSEMRLIETVRQKLANCEPVSSQWPRLVVISTCIVMRRTAPAYMG